jgi:alpha/beta superfamily hydrolase
MTEQLEIRSRDDLSLEAALDSPADPKAILVLCHPHPQMGGTMTAPLLLALSETLVERAWAVLRFNFRGIGGSEGESSTGEAEVADALGATDYVGERFPGLPIAIAGWSFGGAVAVRAVAVEPRYAGCVAIAPAVEPKEGITAGLPDPAGLKGGPPLLLICGANDHLVDSSDCRSWSDEAGAEVDVMKGANHFFWGKYDDLVERAASWLDDKIADVERSSG